MEAFGLANGNGRRLCSIEFRNLFDPIVDSPVRVDHDELVAHVTTPRITIGCGSCRRERCHGASQILHQVITCAVLSRCGSTNCQDDCSEQDNARELKQHQAPRFVASGRVTLVMLTCPSSCARNSTGPTPHNRSGCSRSCARSRQRTSARYAPVPSAVSRDRRG
jgi:hypothetical protein